MTILDLYKTYALEIRVHTSDVIHISGVGERSKDRLASPVKYWTKGKLHRLYVSKMDVFKYGYIDLVTGKIVPSTVDILGDKLSKEEVDHNLTVVRDIWKSILTFFIARLKKKASYLEETLNLL